MAWSLFGNKKTVYVIPLPWKVVRYFSLGVMFWSAAFPRPYDLAIGILVLMPLAAMALPFVLPVWFRFNAPPMSVYASVSTVCSLAGAALFIRAIADWHLYKWEHFWIPFSVLGILIAGLFIGVSLTFSGKLSAIFSGLMLGAFYGFGAAICLNGVMDWHPVIPYPTHVIAKHVTQGGRSVSYYLKIRSWGPVAKTSDYSVDYQVYTRLKAGDPVTVSLGQGAFNIPYYAIH